jgi:proteasome lid subunit RPN8/RPN11
MIKDETINQVKAGETEIDLKLTRNGKYIWLIVCRFPTQDFDKMAEEMHRMDGRLRDLFPNHVQPGSGKVSNFEEVD